MRMPHRLHPTKHRCDGFPPNYNLKEFFWMRSHKKNLTFSKTLAPPRDVVHTHTHARLSLLRYKSRTAVSRGVGKPHPCVYYDLNIKTTWWMEATMCKIQLRTSSSSFILLLMSSNHWGFRWVARESHLWMRLFFMIFYSVAAAICRTAFNVTSSGILSCSRTLEAVENWSWRFR